MPENRSAPCDGLMPHILYQNVARKRQFAFVNFPQAVRKKILALQRAG